MSETFVLTGRSNVLECSFSPPILLDPKKNHYIGLVDFVAYNAIPNVNGTNQHFHYGDNLSVSIPQGSYEIAAINKFLQDQIGKEDIELKPNNNTLQSEIKSTHRIDFTKPNSIGQLLGFGRRVLEPPGVWYRSDLPVNIMSINMICVECNIATGSYINGKVAHTIFAFSPNVPPGYKMALSPRTIIYNRINTGCVDRVSINITDQDGKPVDFAGEEVTVRLHIKSDG
ncbi:unnamed protein product [Bemisia tabaci]|uniref:Uncharacterized protein n=1 Tax=Bemisia tabaci TaxID=7038 RepID=A0A9P0ANM5_BEMTA|nr:unnamed protein product [Bemisia tabaci]